MATTPKLTRQQIARIVNNDEQAIRAFEAILKFTSEDAPISLDGILNDLSNVTADSTAALLLAQSINDKLSQIVEALDVPIVPVPVVQDDHIPPPIQPARPKYYGAFSDSTTQTAAAINTAYPITFNTTDLSYGISIGTPTSRVYVENCGVYNFQFSAQLDKTLGGVGLVFIWARVNGVDVPRSAGKIRIKDNLSESVPAWNYIIEMAAGDYFELVWGVDDTGIVLHAEAASSPYPAVPSVILTVTDNIS